MSGVHPKVATVGELKEGDRLGPYTIMRKLGSGGMADVYFSMHEELHRPAAVKVLRPSLAGDESNLQRFVQEARAAASLVHPNIVQVYDVGQQEDLNQHVTIRYIAQEYVDGRNLRQYLEQHGTMSIREALSVLLQTLAALKKSSSAGVVHRDIKPENILLTPEGDVKVTDFGLARLLHDDPQLTRAGTTLGTPMYMSPEQLQDGEVDVRSDLYSLGVTLFHMLAGKPPFSGETPLALAMQHVQAQPPKLNELRPDIPKSLSKLVERLLAKQPHERFSNPDEVVAYLRGERKSGLAEFWPEQTIPLPGAERPPSSAAPSPATLKLQAQLNRLRQAKQRKWFAAVAVVILGMLSAAMGGLYAQSRPRPSLFGNSEKMYVNVPKQESVEKQYLYALLNNTPRNRHLWEAVPHFFRPEESNINRLYAGKAWLQEARQLLKQEEAEKREAERLLRQITAYPEMDDLVKALAWLELAALAHSRNDDKAEAEHITKAALLREKGWSDADDEIFLANIPEPFAEMFSADRQSPTP